LGARLSSRAGKGLEWLLGQRTPGGVVRRLVLDLERKGVQTSLIYGSLDEGLDALEIHFGPRGNRLDKLNNIDVKLIDKVDHALFSQSARHVVMAQFDRFLRERILNARRPAAVPDHGLRVAQALRR
jgi:hypothetical protein